MSAAPTAAPSNDSAEIVRLAIDTVRTLSMDAVQAAESGHPGTPMALAPLAYALYTRHLRHDPSAPDWLDRDRFVLSIGHASMLLYSSLHLSGYALPLEEIKHFRQWKSMTPGHPEVHHTPGVETTTGPLGQGLANAVGFAVAEAQLAAEFNREGHEIVDHHTYFVAGDGCLMEGISHEASSYAGHFKLGKLIGFFDDNHITIDGSTDLSCSDDAAARFGAYGWQVLHIADVNDLDAIDAAIAAAKADTTRPTMIITRTHIGFGSPNKQDTAKAHGEPLGKDEIALTKAGYGWNYPDAFHVPDEVRAHWKERVAERARTHTEWGAKWAAYAAAHPALATELMRRLRRELPAGLNAAFPTFDATSGNVATRAASGIVINAIAPQMPELVGGSADLTGSNLTNVKGAPYFAPTVENGRNFHFGIREHAMGAIMNGMALHGGIVPYGGTFLVFSDYMRPAIRLAALMRIHAIYVFTHDSIGLGEDGPTHQPVEHLAISRATPNTHVFRPADLVEVAEAWELALTTRGTPSVLALSRQNVAAVRTSHTGQNMVARGAYVLAEATARRQVILIATGSEVEIALRARTMLEAEGIGTRVVSMPCMELFAAQDEAWRKKVLPAGPVRVAIEAGVRMGWDRWLLGERGREAKADFVGMIGFGASAPAERLYQEFGITAEVAVAKAKALLKA